MKSGWSDAEANGLSDLDLLVYASRLIGAETSLVVWGGGNTSIKVTERDFRGRDLRVLRVKGSGSDLKSIARKDFPGVRMDEILALLEREEMGDREMVDYLSHALQEPGGPRPSIETLLHGFLPFDAVIHTHADAIVSLTNTDRCAEVLRQVYGREVVAIPYRRPGFLLSKDVARAVRGHPDAKAVILEKHGTINWGQSVKEAYLATLDLITRAEEAIAARSRGHRRFGGPRVQPLSPEARREAVLGVAPFLRGLVGRDRRVILHFDDTPDMLEFAGSAEAATLSQIGPATPDHTIYTKRLPCFVPVERPGDPDHLKARLQDAVARFVADYTSYFEANRFEGATLLDSFPRVILLPGLGMFTTGKDKRSALIVADLYQHTVSALGAASALGRYVSLTPKEAFDVEYWPLELYKLALAPPEKELARRIALVTGGASGIGRAVALRLAREGAHVVIGDVDEGGALKTAEEIVGVQGAGRAIGLLMDVTREASVGQAMEETILAYGGLDIVVSNAGVAHAAPLDRMESADWERSLAVNATGHFLVAREALRVLKAQGLGGAFVFVATKNVMSPGKDFGAYSVSKAAEAQLAKIVALEGGPFGIRSNIVNPDAVFQDSKLWSAEVRRERAEAQGIPVAELEEFYRKRNLLGVSVLPEDVAEVVCFLASDRSAKTSGCTITVDGGLKDAFPR
ncbi:MAG: bifunctional rhamnulose-1-phosphate aldolase/short-chain dehydrogenase [Candidatus Rokubacteria bacterium]|nr:bifunctional rhamnulose-1-phosphate aldolase/short-chain dehydrogenase [Candidatus Rokubacteria bacterium]